MVEILKKCEKEDDIINLIYNTYVFNFNGEMIYCPRKRNFIENDNHLKMFLEWDEKNRWNIIEILVETQNNALIQPFFVPFNY